MFGLVIALAFSAGIVSALSSSSRIDEIWIDDFSTDTSDTYGWDVAYNPLSIPGGKNYERYHHDARDYSYTKYVSNGELNIIGDDWLSGRIYAYKTIHFKKPVEKLKLEVKGTAYQGYYNNPACLGVAIYESESEFLKDFNIDSEKGACANTYYHALMASVETVNRFTAVAYLLRKYLFTFFKLIC